MKTRTLSLITLIIALSLPAVALSRPGKHKGKRKGHHEAKIAQKVVVVHAAPRAPHGHRHRDAVVHEDRVRPRHLWSRAERQRALRAAIRELRDRIERKERRLVRLEMRPRTRGVRARMQDLRQDLRALYDDLARMRAKLHRMRPPHRRVAHVTW